MKGRALHFIEIPTRSSKPRKKGLTLARDYGIGYHQAEDWVSSVGEYIDYIKIRHFFALTASMDKNDLTIRKIQLYKEHQIDVNPGGIVFEMAVLSNKVNEAFATFKEMGFTAVEISENIIPLNLDDKIKYVKMAKSHSLKVLFEVGEKYAKDPLNVDLAVNDIKTLLNAGTDLIILEKSQIEILLGERGERLEAKRLVKLVDKIGLECIVFEAEAIPHQAWLFHTFGPDTNIGPNLEPDYIAKLEATRRTLSREGGYTWMMERLKKKSNK